MKTVPSICLISVAIAVTACSKSEEQTTATPTPVSSSAPAQPSIPPGSYGAVDELSCERVAGWVWIVPQTGLPLKVNIIEAGKIVGTATADVFRQDLKDAGQGDGVHGFNVPLPSSLKDGHSHTISVKASGSDFELQGSPKTITCPGG
jgi:hypothetical protein